MWSYRSMKHEPAKTDTWLPGLVFVMQSWSFTLRISCSWQQSDWVRTGVRAENVWALQTEFSNKEKQKCGIIRGHTQDICDGGNAERLKLLQSKDTLPCECLSDRLMYLVSHKHLSWSWFTGQRLSRSHEFKNVSPCVIIVIMSCMALLHVSDSLKANIEILKESYMSHPTIFHYPLLSRLFFQLIDCIVY